MKNLTQLAGGPTLYARCIFEFISPIRSTVQNLPSALLSTVLVSREGSEFYVVSAISPIYSIEDSLTKRGHCGKEF